jgi:hypothetical protein
MYRRHFLKNSGQFALAVSAANLISNEVANFLFIEDKPFFKLSLAQWSLHRAISESKPLIR